MADRKTFRLKIVSPERLFYEGDAEFLELKTTEGEIGIYPEHISMTSIIESGVMRVVENGETKEAALNDGFVEILPDRVTILAEACEWPDEIDLHRAKEAKLRAERRLKSGDGNINLARAELALRKSLTRIELAKRK